MSYLLPSIKYNCNGNQCIKLGLKFIKDFAHIASLFTADMSSEGNDFYRNTKEPLQLFKIVY